MIRPTGRHRRTARPYQPPHPNNVTAGPAMRFNAPTVQVTAAAKSLTEALAAALKAIGRAFLAPEALAALERDDLRRIHGRHNLIPESGLWLSDACAGWLCGTSCPDPDKTGCAHRCHGGPLR